MPQKNLSDASVSADAALPSAERPKLHLQYIDGFRGLAALYVVVEHAWLQTWPVAAAVGSPSLWMRLLDAFLDYGKFAVTFFIAISGFCLMLPVLRNEGSLDKRRFFLRRARRILPPYYAALLLSVALVTAFITNRAQNPYEVALPTTAAGLVSHLLLLHNLHALTITQINPPMWSIAVECQIYLLFPLLVDLRRRYGMFIVLLITCVASFALDMAVEGTPYAGLRPLYLFVFSLGMYAAEAVLGPRRKRFFWIGLAAALAMLFVFLHPQLHDLVLVDAIFGILAMCLLILCGQWPRNPLARLACLRPVAACGLFSYSLYLIHFPLQELLWQHGVQQMHLGRIASFAVIGGAGTALIVLLAFLFYLVFERPFCRLTGPVVRELPVSALVAEKASSQ